MHPTTLEGSLSSACRHEHSCLHVFLHFCIRYMPYVPDKDWIQYAPGRSQFTAGSFTNDADTMAGDRSTASEYNGARIISRLNALGLPSPKTGTKEMFSIV